MKHAREFRFKPLAITLSSALLLNAEVALSDNSKSPEGVTLSTVTVQGQSQETQVGDARKEVAPVSKGTLTKSQLEKFVGLDSAVTGALKYLPGVHVSGGDNSGITEGGLNIRGFSQVLVLMEN